MMNEENTFEAQMDELEKIVTQLERGDVPLEQALEQFKQGVALSNQLQKKLAEAEHTLTKVINDQGAEVPYERAESND